MVNPIDNEYIRYIGSEVPYSAQHDGMLRPVVGVHNIQVFRANRGNPNANGGFSNTYNHAPNIIYWNDCFYLSWLSNPISEHIGKSQTVLSTSKNGENWSKPIVLFPPYPLDLSVDNGNRQDLYVENEAYACMHQRMGFYKAPDGRLLCVGYYGLSAEVSVLPCSGNGIGRVVRELYKDGSFSDIYFLIMNKTCGYNEKNALFPMYTTSGDAGFISACEALLGDKLIMLQMWEENRDCEEDYFSIRGAGEAFNYYKLNDETIIGLWKHSRVSKSLDGGKTWLPVMSCPSLVMSGGKIWGERTSDGRYALAYNPVSDSCHRWPLAVITSEDGINFSDMLCVHGEVPLQRYYGFWRDYGPNYVRGLEGETSTPDGGMWLTYSMNKEDIWVSYVPVPITGVVSDYFKDDFSGLAPHTMIPNWNIYSPMWAEVSLEAHPTSINPEKMALRLRSRNPYDYAKAVRVFPKSEKVTLEFEIEARQNYFGKMEIDVCDERGLAVFRVILDTDRTVKLKHGNGFTPVMLYDWTMTVKLTLDCYKKTATAELYNGLKDSSSADKKPIKIKDLRFFGNAPSVERIEFRTGEKRRLPLYDYDVEFAPPNDLPNSEEPLTQEAVYYIHSLSAHKEMLF